MLAVDHDFYSACSELLKGLRDMEGSAWIVDASNTTITDVTDRIEQLQLDIKKIKAAYNLVVASRGEEEYESDD